jgi:hypothetical protein
MSLYWVHVRALFAKWLDVAERDTYEFESNAASFYAANCEVEEDAGAL